ncbi:MAG: rbsR [Conexibacter sp.]|nr:rbsR [Conexibacter sp.]
MIVYEMPKESDTALPDLMEPISRKPRLRDVAAAAGVSVATASRVFSNSPNVSPAAVGAVLAASERLNYRLDPIARALRTQVTGTVGMLVPDISNPFFAELIEAVARVLERANLDLLLADSRGSLEREARWLVTLGERKVDGLLVVPSHHHQSLEPLRRASAAVPVVQLDRQVDDLPADFVGVDNIAGLRMVLDHLLDQGVRRVAMISGVFTTSTGRGRLAAFRTMLEQRPALEAGEPLLGDFSVAFGRSAARALVAGGQLPEAAVCGSDIIALGVMAELRTLGLHVPRDVLVTGFDGIPMTELTDPPLTTVRQPFAGIAAEAARLLQLRIGGDDGPPQRSEIVPELVARASSHRESP